MLLVLQMVFKGKRCHAIQSFVLSEILVSSSHACIVQVAWHIALLPAAKLWHVDWSCRWSFGLCDQVDRSAISYHAKSLQQSRNIRSAGSTALSR